MKTKAKLRYISADMVETDELRKLVLQTKKDGVKPQPMMYGDSASVASRAVIKAVSSGRKDLMKLVASQEIRDLMVDQVIYGVSVDDKVFSSAYDLQEEDVVKAREIIKSSITSMSDEGDVTISFQVDDLVSDTNGKEAVVIALDPETNNPVVKFNDTGFVSACMPDSLTKVSGDEPVLPDVTTVSSESAEDPAPEMGPEEAPAEEERPIFATTTDEDLGYSLFSYEDASKSLYIKDMETEEARYYGEWDGEEDPTDETLAEELAAIDTAYVEDLMAQPPEEAISESMDDIEPDTALTQTMDPDSEMYGDSDIEDEELLSSLMDEIESKSTDDPVLGESDNLDITISVPQEDQEGGDMLDDIVEAAPQEDNGDFDDVFEEMFGEEDVKEVPVTVGYPSSKFKASRRPKTVSALPRVKSLNQGVAKTSKDPLGWIGDAFAD